MFQLDKHTHTHLNTYTGESMEVNTLWIKTIAGGQNQVLIKLIEITSWKLIKTTIKVGNPRSNSWNLNLSATRQFKATFRSTLYRYVVCSATTGTFVECTRFRCWRNIKLFFCACSSSTRWLPVFPANVLNFCQWLSEIESDNFRFLPKRVHIQVRKHTHTLDMMDNLEKILSNKKR